MHAIVAVLDDGVGPELAHQLVPRDDAVARANQGEE
jgi:hypothetical protein